MMHLYEDLKDRALKLIEMKSTIDDIKAEKDLLLINNTINEINIFPQNIKAGIDLDAQLNHEYPEIQLLCDAASAMQNAAGINSRENVYKTPQKSVVDSLTTDCFGILASVLIKHKVISIVKEFIRSVE